MGKWDSLCAGLVFSVIMLSPQTEAAWSLETSIGSTFRSFVNSDEEPVALDAVTRDIVYVATYDWQTDWGRILKWTSTAGWSQVTNSQVSGKVLSLDAFGSDLYIGGEFDFVGASNLTAENVARLNFNTGVWSAHADGLRADASVNVVKVAAWGGFGYAQGNRTYLYIGGNFTSVNGNSCGYVARAYKGSTAWIWETMNGGVGYDYWTPIVTIDLDPLIFNSTLGYTHQVYVGGSFTGAGGAAATNVAVWSDNSGWSGLGASGSGVTGLSDWWYPELGECSPHAEPRSGPCSSLTYAGGGNVILLGDFNRANTSNGGIWWDDPGSNCVYYQPMSIAAVSSYTSLGLFQNTRLWNYASNVVAAADISIASSGDNIFIAGTSGLVPKTGSIPTGNELAVGAYRINGPYWYAIETASAAQTPTPTYWGRNTWLGPGKSVSAAGTGAFFIVYDTTNGFNLRRYKE